MEEYVDDWIKIIFKENIWMEKEMEKEKNIIIMEH